MERFLPGIGFAAAVFWALVIALRFNLRTASHVRSVQTALEAEGQVWPFWTDSGRLQSFLFQPQSLVSEADIPAVREAKKQLIKHRAELVRWLAIAVIGALALVFAGLGAAVAVAFARTH